MTAVLAAPPSPADSLAELADEFELLGDWEERLRYVIDMGRELTPLADDERCEANKVPGCLSQVWLVSDPRAGGVLDFRADSDGIISRGNVALLLRLYSGRTPEQILGFDAKAALDRLGLPQALTPGRSNGLWSMVQRIRREAAAVQPIR